MTYGLSDGLCPYRDPTFGVSGNVFFGRTYIKAVEEPEKVRKSFATRYGYDVRNVQILQGRHEDEFPIIFSCEIIC